MEPGFLFFRHLISFLCRVLQVRLFTKIYIPCVTEPILHTPGKLMIRLEDFRILDHIASGDDMLLMKKIQAGFPDKTGYIKDQARNSKH